MSDPKATHEVNSAGEVKKIPSEQFLSMIIIQLRQAEIQTGMSYVEFLESFEAENPDWNPDSTVDSYDDVSLRTAIHKYMDKNYPPKDK